MSQTIKGQHNAYTANQREKETVRETDARALLSCANKLEAARRPGAPIEEYVDAVKHNLQLWTVFQVCITEPDSQLPQDLKVLLLNISRYVDKVSFRAMSEHNPDLLSSLININRQIAAGLNTSQNPSQQAPSTAAPAQTPPTAGSFSTTA